MWMAASLAHSGFRWMGGEVKPTTAQMHTVAIAYNPQKHVATHALGIMLCA
jgi:hypothetical protein